MHRNTAVRSTAYSYYNLITTSFLQFDHNHFQAFICNSFLFQKTKPCSFGSSFPLAFSSDFLPALKKRHVEITNFHKPNKFWWIKTKPRPQICFCESSHYLQALPGQTASQEIHEHVTESLQVIPPALFCIKEHQDAC